MPANVLVAIGCIALAAGLFFLSWRGWIKSVVVDRVEKVASLVAVLVGIVAFINPFAGAGAATPTNQVVYQGPATGNIVAQADKGDVHISGDPSTRADKRYADALVSVTDELSDNFGRLAVVTQAVADHPPHPFYDSRRLNESELAYQDRAVDAFRDYRAEIDQYAQLLAFSKTTLGAFEHDLGYNATVAQHIKDTYAQQEAAVYALTSYVAGLQHEIALNTSDLQRTARSASLHREKVAAARFSLATAAAYFCLATDQESALAAVSEALSLASIAAQLQPGEEGYRVAMQLAGAYAMERAQVLRERQTRQSQAAARAIDRRITDPYLIMVREAVGLPPTLTITEVVSLQNKQIDRDETQPEKLFALAALSYLESDGRAAVDYFRRAIATDQLPEILKRYAEASIHRLEEPDAYDGSIGLMVLKLVPGGNFATAGVTPGDVIIALNGVIAKSRWTLPRRSCNRRRNVVLVVALLLSLFGSDRSLAIGHGDASVAPEPDTRSADARNQLTTSPGTSPLGTAADGSPIGPSGLWRIFFGSSVASAGDVNGDGYADVITGEAEITDGRWLGTARVYHGAAAGLPTQPSWTMSVPFDELGSLVGPAGDVNGDGFDDVLIAAHDNYSGRTSDYVGRAILMHGTASGLTATPVWQVTGMTLRDGFARSLATAGDVDGNGVPDTIVGASTHPLIDLADCNGTSCTTTTGAGRVYVYQRLAADTQLGALRLRRADDSAPIYPGGSAASADSIRLAALAHGLAGQTDVKLQWEIKEYGKAFDGSGLGESAWQNGGTQGFSFNELVTGLRVDRRYHWRARVLSRASGQPAAAPSASRWANGGAFFTTLTGQQPIAGSGRTQLLGQAAYVDVASQGNPPLTSLTLRGYPHTMHPKAGVAAGLAEGARILSRYFTIAPNAGAAGYRLRLCLSYADSDVAQAGAAERLLELCRWDGSAWRCLPRSAASDASANLACADDVTALSDWIIVQNAAAATVHSVWLPTILGSQR